MKGVRFDNIHTYDEWGLILSKKEIKSPAPKIMQVDIEGGDGVLDYSEYFGEVKYNNRSLSFTFTLPHIPSQKEYLALFTTVQNAIHGQKMKVILDDDSGFYYVGRVTVNEWKSNKNIGEIVIEVDAEPYKLKVLETVVQLPIAGKEIIVLTNLRKRVVPTIITDAPFTFAWGNYSKAVGAGTFQIVEMELSAGNNTITVTGTGNVTFRYVEGGL